MAVPPPPDYNALIPVQQASDLANFNTQLGAGRVNTTNPYGNQQWSRGPNGEWQLNQSFSPQTQQIFDALQGQGWSGPNYQYNGGSRDAAEQALYNRQTRYLDPQMQEDQRMLQERLVGQGLNIGDTAYNKAIDTFQRGKERAYGAARDSAITGAGQEATGELTRGLMAHDARTAFDAAKFARGAGGGFGQAQFGTPGLPGTDYLGAANQGYVNQLAGYNANQAASENKAQGWWNLANTGVNAAVNNPDWFRNIGGFLSGMFAPA